MSKKYDEYLQEHKNNVIKGYEWLRENLYWITTQEIWDQVEHQVKFGHDASKNDEDEYEAYDNYFYGNKSYEVVQNFEMAWLNHIHKNPHHWQHWILYHDDPNKKPYTCLPIPENYIIEMICDWWSFSWKSGNLYEIYQWYENHREYMKINDTSRTQVEMILDMMKIKLVETYHQEISEMMSDNNGEK